ncbi:MAG: hypothetical protein ABIS50_06585 [Luteolibacter sp.]|uniref:hypothetical protein n=1 Tax=Luteolibacter sp. TaxID=1962973 RepID=UPI003265BF06
MKRILTILISGVGILSAGTVEWTEENRRIEAEQVLLWESKLAEAQGESPDVRPADLWLGLQNMGYRKDNHEGHSPAVDAIYLKIQQELLAVPSHAFYFSNEIKREQKGVASYPTSTGPRVSYDFNRTKYFRTLSRLPSPETISVLGDFLSDDKDAPAHLETLGSDWGENPKANSYGSSVAIANIGLRNPPATTESYEKNPEEHLAKTRAWWEQIKSGRRTFSFVGQKVEYRFKADGTWETIAMANPPNDGPKPTAAAQTAPSLKSNKNINDSKSRVTFWAWILGGVTALLSGLVWRRIRLSASK